ncbi:AAA family ATPase [Sphingomonas aerolata]|uniref:ExeA family protein n=1 Tax=Sphingomonas aerolata TaxID=185951 RepID=UPI002FE09A37
MYDEHYGLTGRPFQLTPDPRFWFESGTHRKAMAYLGYGLAQGEGFIVMTGDIGAGKTTLVGHLMDTDRPSEPERDPAGVDHDRGERPAADRRDRARRRPGGARQAQLLTAIERGLHAVARTGKRTLLIVDEAQALPGPRSRNWRMLSNLQTAGHALLQILLLGQPEFRDRLHGSDGLEQLRQRVIAIHHLDPMEPHEVADYIAHRLSVVGWEGNPAFHRRRGRRAVRRVGRHPPPPQHAGGPRHALCRDRGSARHRRRRRPRRAERPDRGPADTRNDAHARACPRTHGKAPRHASTPPSTLRSSTGLAMLEARVEQQDQGTAPRPDLARRVGRG